MPPAETPLSFAAAACSRRVDVALPLVVVLAVGYFRCRPAARAPAYCFAAGLVTWAVSVTSVIAVYAPVLFWMRALQVLVLLFVVPFLLALGRPVSAVRATLSEAGQARM